MIKEIPEFPSNIVVVTKLEEHDQIEHRLLVEIIDTNSFDSAPISTYELAFKG